MILRNSKERMSDLLKHVRGRVIAGSQEITFRSIGGLVEEAAPSTPRMHPSQGD